MFADLYEMNDNMRVMSTASTDCMNSNQNRPDSTLNIVIRHLPECTLIIQSSKVNTRILDGLKVNGITCASATRNKLSDDSKPVFALATFQSFEDKCKDMGQMTKLKNIN